MKVAAFILIELVLGFAVLFLFRKAPDQRREYIKSIWTYVLFSAMPIPAFLLLPLGHDPNGPFFGAAGMAAWIGLGALWVARRNPQIYNPPWVYRRWWIPDWTLLLITALCAAVAFLG